MIHRLSQKFFSGMTLVELAAVIVVSSVIGLGMTSAAQAVMLHYQTDTVRQDLRSYGNSIMREISREMQLTQKINIDGLNGFARLKLYRFYTDINPELVISCRANEGIEFNNDIPLNGVLKFPNQGIYRSKRHRQVYVKDFRVTYEPDNRPGLAEFKESFLHVELTLSMTSDVMDEANAIEEDHYFYRSIFLGTAYIQKKVTNSVVGDDEAA